MRVWEVFFVSFAVRRAGILNDSKGSGITKNINKVVEFLRFNGLF